MVRVLSLDRLVHGNGKMVRIYIDIGWFDVFRRYICGMLPPPS